MIDKLREKYWSSSRAALRARLAVYSGVILYKTNTQHTNVIVCVLFHDLQVSGLYEIHSARLAPTSRLEIPPGPRVPLDAAEHNQAPLDF